MSAQPQYQGPGGPPAHEAADATIVLPAVLDDTEEIPVVPAAPSRPRRPLALIAAAAGGVLLLAGVGVAAALRHDPAPPPPSPVAIDPANVSASASSVQRPEGQVTYVPANTLDGDPATAWNSDGRHDGPGPGITLTFGFAQPVDLRSITLLNGYQKKLRSADLWALNSRLHRVRVITDAGAWTWDLADVRAPQTLTRDLGRTRSVRLEVMSVFRSTRYLDVAVSEVAFTGLA